MPSGPLKHRRLPVSLFDLLLADIRALFRSKMRKYLKQRSPSSLRNMLGAPPMGALSRDYSTITFLCLFECNYLIWYVRVSLFTRLDYWTRLLN